MLKPHRYLNETKKKLKGVKKKTAEIKETLSKLDELYKLDYEDVVRGLVSRVRWLCVHGDACVPCADCR